jgi:aerobic carbon-monoxide dehydrogenase large subunit
MAKFGVGQPIKRVEDQRLITGKGRYTDDISLPGQAFGYVLRSPHAHARIKGIDTAAAAAAPGVLGVFTAKDFGTVDAGVPCFIPITNKDGSERADPKHPILCRDEVNYVGDNVAFIVAGTLAQAKDAAELVEVDYEELPAVAGTKEAIEPGRPQVHPDAPNNIAFDWFYGDEAKVEAAFKGAAHVTKVELINNRLVCNAMEPRAAVAEFKDGSWSCTPAPRAAGPSATRWPRISASRRTRCR